MKKTLLAVALLGAFAGSAMAADVTLYGRFDASLRYTNVDADVADVDDSNSFEMATGNYTGSRFGIKGEENLGNGMKVAFVLENGFDSDTGDLTTDGKIFDRQATLHLKGSFGEVAFGRVGIMNSTAGSFGMGNFTAMTTGWGDVGNQGLLWGAGFSSRYDNMITYKTPSFAGVTVTAQYSFGSEVEDEDTGDITGLEGKSSTDRYYGIGAHLTTGGLDAMLIVDAINQDSFNAATGQGSDVDDTYRVTLGGSYDFGVVKPYLAAAYFKDGAVSDIQGAYSLGNETTHFGDRIAGAWDGWALAAGADVPLAGGTFHGTLGYMTAENQAAKGTVGEGDEVDRWMIGAGYEYPLSKRTLIYVDAGYFKDSYDAKTATESDIDPSFFQAAIGMAHYF